MRVKSFPVLLGEEWWGDRWGLKGRLAHSSLFLGHRHVIPCSSIPRPCWAGDKLQNRTWCCQELSCLTISCVICGCLHKYTLPTDLCTLICRWGHCVGLFPITCHLCCPSDSYFSAVSASTVWLCYTKSGHSLWYHRNPLQWAARLNYWPGELQMDYNQASKSRGLISHAVRLFWYLLRWSFQGDISDHLNEDKTVMSTLYQ